MPDPNDVHAVVAISAELAADAEADGLRIAYNDAIRSRREALERYDLPTDAEYVQGDVVLLCVPRGRGAGVARSLVSTGMAHGDVYAEGAEVKRKP
jgi:hypothetical protein